LRKTVVNNGTTLYTQDYVNGIEYKNGALEAIYHSEGRVTTIDGTLKYEYAMKDHLGNTRLMFCDRNGDGVIKPENLPEPSEVTQENSYYAFGMNMEFGAWENTPSVTDNLKQYNGKELNTDFGLNWNDYGARFYDPATARWNVMDPMAEKYLAWNPYNYVGNNPIKNIDLKGDSVSFPKQGYSTTMNVSGKVINESSTYYTNDQMKEIACEIEESIVNTFTTTNGGDDGTINLSVNADISAENSNNKLNDSDHAIRVVDDGYIPNGKGGYEGEGTVGKALFGEKTMYINQSIIGNKAAKIPEENAGTGKTSEGGATLIRTTPHELGHSANLQHAPHGTMDNNLMH